MIRLFLYGLILAMTQTAIAETICMKKACLVLPPEAPEQDLLSMESAEQQVESLLRVGDLSPDDISDSDSLQITHSNTSNWLLNAELKNLRELEKLSSRSLEFYRIQYQWKGNILESGDSGLAISTKALRKL